MKKGESLHRRHQILQDNAGAETDLKQLMQEIEDFGKAEKPRERVILSDTREDGEYHVVLRELVEEREGVVLGTRS